MSLTNAAIALQAGKESEVIHLRFEQLKELNKQGKLTNRELATLQREVLKEILEWKDAYDRKGSNSIRSNY